MNVIEQLLRLQRGQIKGIIELRGIKKMLPLYEAAVADTRAKLARLVRLGRGETFTAHHMRMVLLQLTDGVRQFGRGLVDHLETTGAMASTLGTRHSVHAVKTLEKHFTGHMPALEVEQAAVLRGVYKGVQPSLLNRYKKSERLYTVPVVEQIKMQLAKSLVSAESIDTAIDRVVGTDGIFASQRWRAERIVRTELAHSYGVAQHATLQEVKQQIPKLQRKLIETFDDRTGEDSKILHGQIRDMDDPFVYVPPPGKKGYAPFLQPPGRSNDRSCVIPWAPHWEESSITREGGEGPGAVRAEVPRDKAL